MEELAALNPLYGKPGTRRGEAMNWANYRKVVRYLHAVAGPPPAAGPTDGQLLERYVRQRDEAAFELLLWRHGTMVLNVCRRILREDHDAEDAFQADRNVCAT
jgi:hypothetical protein